MEEMVRYAEEFQSEISTAILSALIGRTDLVDVGLNHVKLCKKFIRTPDLGDIVHAAACLKEDAILITNDKHFNRIRDEGIIEVWNITKTIRELG